MVTVSSDVVSIVQVIQRYIFTSINLLVSCIPRSVPPHSIYDAEDHRNQHAKKYRARSPDSPSTQTAWVERHEEADAPLQPGLGLAMVGEQALSHKLLRYRARRTGDVASQAEARDRFLARVAVWILHVAPEPGEVDC